MWAAQLGIKRYFYFQELSFRAIGIDVTSVEQTFKIPILTGVLFLCGTLLNCSWAYYSWIHRQDLDGNTKALLILCEAMLDYWKMLVFIYNHKQLVLLIQSLWLMAKRETKAGRKIIADENVFDSLFSKVFSSSTMSGYFMSAVVPPFITFAYYLKTEHLKLFYPMPISHPFDENKPLNYILIALWIISGCFFFASSSITIDILYSWLVHNISAQFRILKLHFADAALKADPETIKLAIYRCIRHHQKIVELCKTFDMIYSPIIFAEFTVGGMRLCLVLYVLFRAPSRESAPFMVVFLIVVMFQLLIYSYGGQRIEDESQRVGSYIYEVFPLENNPNCCKNLLLLPLMRTQRNCRLTGTFFDANWELFIWVLRNAYSYLTLLMTIVED